MTTFLEDRKLMRLETTRSIFPVRRKTQEEINPMAMMSGLAEAVKATTTNRVHKESSLVNI
jgi:hypothetical protein